MSNQTLQLTPELHRYLLDVSLREPDLLRRLRAETAEDPMARMQIAPEQGQFMQMLVRMLGASRCIEVGVYTGYSSLAIALALPGNGKVLACDVSTEWTAVGQRYWAEAGVADRIDLRIGPAAETLASELAANGANQWDFAFIDADKVHYDTYYEQCLELLRPGGIIAIDNVFWDGSVIDPDVTDADTEAIRTLNRKLHRDTRVDISMVPIGDGLTLARKIP